MKKFLSILLSVALILSCVSTTAFAAVADTDDAIVEDATMTDATSGTDYILGDVNADTKVSVVDAKWVLQNVAGERELDETQTKAADVTLDGRISVLDAKWILQAVAGLRELVTPSKEEEPYVDPDGEEMQALADAIAEATATDATGYTQESVEALAKAVEDAEALLGRDDVKASEIAQAIENMQVAQKALKTDTTALEDAIYAAYTKDTTGYDINSVDEFYAAVAEAEKTLANKDIKPADVAAAVASIEDAEKALKADKSELVAAIESAETVSTEGMTAESTAAFNEALANAKAIKDDDAATAAQVASAIAALESAKNALVVDKEALSDKISKTEALDLNGYTSESVDAVKAAIDAAKAVVDDENSTPAQVAAARENLDNALAALVIDTTDFDAAYTAAKAVDNNGYTAATSAALTAAIAKADAVKENANATVADYAEATAALTDAVAGLKADMTAINASITAATSKDTTGYTAASVSALNDAIAAANAMTENDLPADIAAAKTALDKALNELVIDTTDFNAAYTAAAAIDNNGYTAATSAALTAAIAKADAVKVKADATVADYAEATAALTAAVNGLRADKSALNTAVSTANSIDLEEGDGYTTATASALTTAISSANAVVADENATPAQVTAAKDALETAIAGLAVNTQPLEDLVKEADLKNTADYTAATATPFADARDAAKLALAANEAGTEKLTPARALELKNALSEKMGALVSAKADTTALEDKIQEAKDKLAAKDYTDETVAVLNSAIADGQAVVDSAMPTTAQVDDAIAAINTAIAALVSLDDALAAKKAEAVAADTTGMTAASVAALNSAIAAADSASTAAEKKAAIEAIDNAIAGLTVDKSALEAKINDAKAVDTTGMTPASIEALNEAIAAAETVKANATATVADVTNAIAALNSAISGLKADKTALVAKLNKAKAVDVSECTETSATALNGKIAAAEAVLADDAATVAQVNAAIADLTEAMRNLGDNVLDGEYAYKWPVIDWR